MNQSIAANQPHLTPDMKNLQQMHSAVDTAQLVDRITEAMQKSDSSFSVPLEFHLADGTVYEVPFAFTNRLSRNSELSATEKRQENVIKTIEKLKIVHSYALSKIQGIGAQNQRQTLSAHFKEGVQFFVALDKDTYTIVGQEGKELFKMKDASLCDLRATLMLCIGAKSSHLIDTARLAIQTLNQEVLPAQLIGEDTQKEYIKVGQKEHPTLKSQLDAMERSMLGFPSELFSSIEAVCDSDVGAYAEKKQALEEDKAHDAQLGALAAAIREYELVNKRHRETYDQLANLVAFDKVQCLEKTYEPALKGLKEYTNQQITEYLTPAIPEALGRACSSALHEIPEGVDIQARLRGLVERPSQAFLDAFTNYHTPAAPSEPEPMENINTLLANLPETGAAPAALEKAKQSVHRMMDAFTNPKPGHDTTTFTKVELQHAKKMFAMLDETQKQKFRAMLETACDFLDIDLLKALKNENFTFQRKVEDLPPKLRQNFPPAQAAQASLFKRLQKWQGIILAKSGDSDYQRATYQAWLDALDGSSYSSPRTTLGSESDISGLD